MSFVNNLSRLIVGSSDHMVALRKSVVDVAEHNIPVLILGPSGSGKELVAQSLADMSGRSGRLISVNCASIPHSLLEAELFGYEKGAFTGASKTHKGKFEQAHNGTLFLDEIGDMPQDLQSKLLRALETKTFTPVGSSREVAVDFRLVCATHKNLYKLVVMKTFRSDLFFRISAFPIRIPALRDRSEDIEKLVYHLAQQLSVGLGSGTSFEVEKDALWLLKTFPWPGNIRQLRNVVECLIIRSGGKMISAQQVQKALREQSRQRLHKEASSEAAGGLSLSKIQSSPVESMTDYRSFFVSNGKLIIAEHLKSVEKEVVHAAIVAAADDYSLAAQMLHLSVPELFEKKQLHGL
jgi:DNA-binding NtrC family response regulator